MCVLIFDMFLTNNPQFEILSLTFYWLAGHAASAKYLPDPAASNPVLGCAFIKSAQSASNPDYNLGLSNLLMNKNFIYRTIFKFSYFI